MNEQQLADLFSEQLEQIFLGQEPPLSNESNDLSSLLDLGHQFTQADFILSPPQQVAFENQLTTWFGPTTITPPPTIFGIPKSWFINFMVAALIHIKPRMLPPMSEEVSS